MDKILLWIRKPLGIGLISATSVILVMFANYNYKTKKLAELEYREEVQKAQQEIVGKYQETEDEIHNRQKQFVKDKKEIKQKVDKEVQNAKEDNNASSYNILATDGNISK